MNKIIHHLKEEWYKYLLEIIVLIIGIYGAFAVESWNTNRIEINKAENYKAELYQELESVSKHIHACLNFHDRKLEKIESFFELYADFENPELMLSLMKSISDSIAFKEFDPPRLVLDNLMNSGSVEHLPAISTQIQQLINVYDQTESVNLINADIGIQLEIAFNQLIDPIFFYKTASENYSEHKLVEKWYLDKDSRQYLAYLNYLASLKHYHKRNLQNYPPILDRINNLQGLIKQP